MTGVQTCALPILKTFDCYGTLTYFPMHQVAYDLYEGQLPPELMEVQAGQCRIRLDGSDEWKTYKAGESFSVPGKSRFDIDVTETLDYVCSYL